MKKEYLSILIAVLLILGIITQVNATVINYTVANLTDINPGEDLWQYSYSVSDNTFAADTGLTIYFDFDLFDILDPSPTAPNAEWAVLTWNPDLIFGIPDAGAYDALALVDGASLTDTFTVSFTWLGGSDGPIAQHFDIYDSSFNVMESGITTSAPVPEPGTMLLMSIGLVGLAGVYRQNRRKN